MKAPEAVNLHDADTGRDHLSHSSLTVLQACPRKFYLSRVLRLEPIEQSDALSLGSAFQAGVEHRDPQVAASRVLDAARFGLGDMDRAMIHAAIVESACGLYLRLWRDDLEQREFPYRVRLRNPLEGGRYSRTFDLAGVADGVRDHGTHLELVENKLVGQISEQKIAALRLDQQITLACYALWRATGKPVREVRYRFVRKPSIKQRQGESVREFCARIREDYATRPDFYAVEQVLFRDADDLMETEAELWEWADALRRYRRTGAWPKVTQSCSDYGRCEFVPLCSRQPDAETLYRVRETT